MAFACSLAAVAQNAPDPALLAEIQKIPAIDNHTHVMKVTAPGEKDTLFDALPCEVEAWDIPVFLRPDRPVTNPGMSAELVGATGQRRRVDPELGEERRGPERHRFQKTPSL